MIESIEFLEVKDTPIEEQEAIIMRSYVRVP
jgi:hypothetical protein